MTPGIPPYFMLAFFRRTIPTAVLASGAVLAQAQTPAAAVPMAPAAQIEAPLVGVSEVVGELRTVSYHRADGARTFGVVAEDFAKYFPTAVTQDPDGATIESGAMVAILLALVKENREANAHLSSQIEHVMYDKADLERRLHGLEAEVAELRAAAEDRRLADSSRKRRRREATVKN